MDADERARDSRAEPDGRARSRDRPDDAPDEGIVALPVDPGVVVIRDQREAEAGLLGTHGVSDEVERRVLLARQGISDLHGRRRTRGVMPSNGFRTLGGGHSSYETRTTGGTTMRSTRAFVIGVGAAYFFDPRLGKRRRSVARDKGAKAMRHVTRRSGRKARFVADKTRGYYARGRNVIARPPAETADAIVEQRIRSDALRDVAVSTNDLEIGVEDGVVTLTGEVVGDKVRRPRRANRQGAGSRERRCHAPRRRRAADDRAA